MRKIRKIKLKLIEKIEEIEDEQALLKIDETLKEAKEGVVREEEEMTMS